MHPDQHVLWSQELYHAAQSHVDDIGPKGLAQSSTGLSIYDRLNGYPDIVPGMLSEVVGFGTQNPTEALILMMLINNDNSAHGDDFTKTLDNFLNPIHKQFGFALAKHASDLGYVAVIPMCLEFLTKA